MVRKFTTKSGSVYFIDEEKNTMSGGCLPRPMTIAYLSPIMGGCRVYATLADPEMGMVRIKTSVVE